MCAFSPLKGLGFSPFFFLSFFVLFNFPLLQDLNVPFYYGLYCQLNSNLSNGKVKKIRKMVTFLVLEANIPNTSIVIKRKMVNIVMNNL